MCAVIDLVNCEPEIKLFSNTSGGKCICQMKTHRLAAQSRKQTGFHCQNGSENKHARSQSENSGSRVKQTRHTQSGANPHTAALEHFLRLETGRPSNSDATNGEQQILCVRNKKHFAPVAPAPLPWRRNLRSRKRVSGGRNQLAHHAAQVAYTAIIGETQLKAGSERV